MTRPAEQLALADERDGQKRARALPDVERPDVGGDELPLLLDVGDLHRLSAHPGPANRPLAEPDRRRPHDLQVLRRDAVRGPQVKTLRGLLELVHDPAVAAGELDRAGDDRLEHGLEVERGADGLADLAEGLELADRARQLAGPRFQLLEEADVLDGDHRLLGEGLEERDLALREPARRRPPDRQPSDRVTFAQHRHGENAAKAASLRLRRDPVVGFLENIRDVHDGARQDRPRTCALTARWHGEGASQRRSRLGVDVRESRDVHELAVERQNPAVPCAA